MTPRENDAFGGETSPFLGEAPLRIAVRAGLDSFVDEEMTGRLDTPWLNEDSLAEPFTAEDEVWNDSTEQLDFRERVLSAHIERSRQRLGKRTPLRDLRDDELAAVAGTDIKMRSDAAAQAGRLIKAANAALKNAQAAGDASAMVTTRITANSGYRGRDYQRGLWLDYFGGDHGYYNDSRKAREKLDAGPHSSQAVAYMLNTFGLPDKIAAPGYSNHQAGIAIDLMQKRKDGHPVRNSTNPGWRETWRKTWFHQWLKEHAASFGFVPYRKEEWHWEYKPDAAAKLQAGGETSWLQDRISMVPEQDGLSEWKDEQGPEEELDSSDDEQNELELRTFDPQFTEEEEEEEDDDEEEELDVTDGHEATVDDEDFVDADQEGSFDLLFDSETMFPSGESLPSVTGFPEGKGQDYWDPSKAGNPLLDTGPAHKDKRLSANLTVRELTTSGGKSVDVARIDPKLVECLQRLRDHVGKPITITSGYRSWKRNKEVYASRNQKPTLSQHCGGRAADIRIQGMNGLEIGKAAIDAYGPNIGVGLAAGYAHIDVRGFSAAWNYGKAEDSWVAEIKRYQKAKGGSPAQSASGTTPKTGAVTTPEELVRFAQCVMNVADGERLREDGDLGQLTRSALERFRARYGLPSANVLDGRVQIALAQKAIEAITRTSRFATVGERDARTVEEIRSFQLENRVRVTGELDAATRAAFVATLSRTKMFGPGAASSATPEPNFYEQTIRKHPLYDSPKRIADLDLLEPVTRERVHALIRGAAEQGIKLMVWETYRSKARQEELFKKGTTKLHAVGVHHYGLACDLVRNENGEPSWKGDFKFMAVLARVNKLVWGGDWGIAGRKPSFYDPYHLQRCRLSRQKSLFNGTWYPDEDYDPYIS